jgi:hypothetical protein
LISLGIFALGLVLAASVFALIAAGVDIARFVSRWGAVRPHDVARVRRHRTAVRLLLGGHRAVCSSG